MTEIRPIKCGMVNCWLLKGDTGSVLVDTAVIRYKDILYNAVKDENVQLIFLTHGHIDHIGNAAYLAEKLGVPVGMSEKDVDILRKSGARPMQADTFLGKIILGGTARNLYVAPAFTPARFFEDGDSLAEYGVDVRVVALPGHTKGSLGLIVNGTDFIVGDVMMNILRPTHGRLYEDRAQLLQSVEKIRESGCTTIHSGHGKPFPSAVFFQPGRPHIV